MPDNDTDQPQPATEPDSDAPPVEPSPSTQEQPAQPPMYPQIAVNLAPDGLHISVLPAPVHVGISAENMDIIAKTWLDQHPALWEQIVHERIEAARKAQTQLQAVKDPATVRKISRSKRG